MEDVAVTPSMPTVLQIPLPYVRLIQEAVIVRVVMPEVILVVRQYLCTQLLAQVDVGISIGLHFTLAVTVQVQRCPLLGIGFQIFHVYLSCDALVAVFNGRSTLRYLYATHPRAGNIVQRIRCGSTTEVGKVLSQHLHISAAQSQEFNLSGSRGSITIFHINGGRGRKALAKVATGSLEQFLTTYDDAIFGTTHSADS